MGFFFFLGGGGVVLTKFAMEFPEYFVTKNYLNWLSTRFFFSKLLSLRLMFA